MQTRIIATILLISAALGAPLYAQVNTVPDQAPGSTPTGSSSSAVPPGTMRDTKSGASPNCACARPGASASVESSMSADAAAASSSTKVPPKPAARVTGGSQTNVLGCTC